MKVCICCKTRYQKGSGITFHKFPTDTLTKQLWVKILKKEDWSPKFNDHLCSKHFTQDCFIKHVSRTTLKCGSVPTLFIVSAPFVLDDKTTPTPCVSKAAGVKRKFSSADVYHENTYLDEAGPSKPQKKSRTTTEICESINHDHCYQNSARSTNIILQRVKISLSMSRGRLKALSQRVKRLKITVSSLKNKIRLKKKSCLMKIV